MKFISISSQEKETTILQSSHIIGRQQGPGMPTSIKAEDVGYPCQESYRHFTQGDLSGLSVYLQARRVIQELRNHNCDAEKT